MLKDSKNTNEILDDYDEIPQFKWEKNTEEYIEHIYKYSVYCLYFQVLYS